MRTYSAKNAGVSHDIKPLKIEMLIHDEDGSPYHLHYDNVHIEQTAEALNPELKVISS